MKKSALALAAVAFSALAHGQIVYSNNAGGDDFTNSDTVNYASQQVNSYSGPNGEYWNYENVRSNGHVGINSTSPRSGNGSAYLSTESGHGITSRADIALRSTNGYIGVLDALDAWQADTLTTLGDNFNLSPVLRLELYSATDTKVGGGTGVYGSLVFDTSWTPGTSPSITNGVWNTFDMLGGNYYVQGTSSLGAKYNSGPDGNGNGERLLGSYLADLANKDYVVLSASAGFGSTNYDFTGAVDNYKIGFGGVDHTYNFESVPEPCSMVLLGLGALAGFKKARRK